MSFQQFFIEVQFSQQVLENYYLGNYQIYRKAIDKAYSEAINLAVKDQMNPDKQIYLDQLTEQYNKSIDNIVKIEQQQLKPKSINIEQQPKIEIKQPYIFDKHVGKSALEQQQIFQEEAKTQSIMDELESLIQKEQQPPRIQINNGRIQRLRNYLGQMRLPRVQMPSLLQIGRAGGLLGIVAAAGYGIYEIVQSFRKNNDISLPDIQMTQMFQDYIKKYEQQLIQFIQIQLDIEEQSYTIIQESSILSGFRDVFIRSQQIEEKRQRFQLDKQKFLQNLAKYQNQLNSLYEQMPYISEIELEVFTFFYQFLPQIDPQIMVDWAKQYSKKQQEKQQQFKNLPKVLGVYDPPKKQLVNLLRSQFQKNF